MGYCASNASYVSMLDQAIAAPMSLLRRCLQAQMGGDKDGYNMETTIS